MNRSIRQILSVLFGILYVALLCFMVSQSLESGDASQSESGKISLFLIKFDYFKELSDRGELDGLVRKFIGHFCEFGLLGILGYLFFYFLTEKIHLRILNLFLGMISCAVTESAQIFSVERGPSVFDAFIDFQGYAAAFCAMTFIFYYIFLFKKTDRSLIIRLFVISSPFIALSTIPCFFVSQTAIGEIICCYSYLIIFAISIIPPFITELLIQRKKPR